MTYHQPNPYHQPITKLINQPIITLSLKVHS
jgi:hypothetical protein